MFGIDDLISAGLKILDKVIPDPAAKLAAQQKLMELKQTGDLAQLQAEVTLATAQTDINKVEAGSASLLVSGARPAFMWVGVVGAAYQWILSPFMATLWGFPVIHVDPDVLWFMGSLLGLHVGARTVEKIQGVATK